jgi:hypothetical protein
MAELAHELLSRSTEGHGERRIVECEPSPPVATYREGGA